MKFANSFILATLIMLICGVAHARGIQYDCGQYDINQAIPASNTYSTDNLTLSFSPGADNAPFNGNTSCSGNEDPNDFMAQGGFYQSGNMLAADWQILVTNTSSAFTVEFLYSSDISTNDPNCAGETATLSLSTGGSYSYRGACAGSGDYLFNFTSAGQLVGSSPFPGATAAAPEIDSGSAASGLTLLIGLITVMLGRRQLDNTSAKVPAGAV